MIDSIIKTMAKTVSTADPYITGVALTVNEFTRRIPGRASDPGGLHKLGVVVTTAVGSTAGTLDIGNNVGVATKSTAAMPSVSAAATEDGCKRLNFKSIVR